MAEFIDYGDNCSDGPPSTIGQYDLQDDFIDDDDLPASSPLFVPNPDSPRVSIERYRSVGSSRFTTPDPRRGVGELSSRRQEDYYRESSTVSRTRGRPSPYPGLAERERVRLIRGRVRGDGPRNSSQASGRSNSYQSTRRTESPFIQESQSSDLPLRSVSTLSGVQNVSDEREPRDGGEDPFEVPNHLRGGELAGLGLPGKRLGSGKPRWSARYFLFTTSQSGFDWPYQQLVDICETLGAKHRISRELHADGGYHFHAFVDFERKFEFENCHRFCVGERSGNPRPKCPVKTHCNILPITRTPFNTWDYVGKYGDIVSDNCERPRPRGPNTTRDDMWTGSMALANEKEFLKDVQKHSARDFVLFNKQITTYARGAYANPQPQMPTIEEDGIFVHWERYPEARTWVVQNLSNPIDAIRSTSRGVSYPPETEAEDREWIQLHRPDGKRPRRPKSLIVYGDSRLGKTIFATNLGPHVHWQRDFNLRKLMNMGVDTVDYAIFDDIDWKNAALKGEGFKAWLGGNRSFDVSDKFDRKFTLEWGKPCIYLTNHNPWIGLHENDAKWLRRNCIYVELGPDDDERSNAICSGDAFSEV